MIVVTGATGQLGRLVIASLLKKVPAAQIVAAVRDPSRAADLAEQGVQVRRADYADRASLDAAFHGAEKVLLISSSEVGQRVVQHQNVIDAAKQAGASLVAYTSLVHLETSPLFLAGEHSETEAYLKASGVPYAMLRNGWYTENYLASIPPALAHNAYIGSAGDGRIASAARADYAEAAAVILTLPSQGGKTYELAGDEAYTLPEFAKELSKQSGKEIPYVNLPEDEFKAALLKGGLPDGLAFVLANSDTGASKGALFDDQHQLSALIGRPTASLSTMIAEALK